MRVAVQSAPMESPLPEPAVGATTQSGRSWVLDAAWAVLATPSLWPAALRQLRRLADPGWWRSPPPAPMPPPEYQRFRALTAYGDPEGRMAREDVLAYLRWCRDWERVR